MLAARVLRASAPRVAAANARPLTAQFLPHARGYAEAASSNKSAPDNTRPPIELYGVDGTYASALYTAAAKNSTLDGTASAINKLADTFSKDKKLDPILHAPTLSAEDKSALVSELLKVANVQASSKEGTTVKGFLDLLASNNRLGVLEGVCEKFAQLMSASKGEVELRVTSAEELDRKVLQRIEQAVSKSRFVGQGRKLKVVPVVQPDIRGGLIVEVGDRTIDLSVSSKMAKMNNLLRETL